MRGRISIIVTSSSSSIIVTSSSSCSSHRGRSGARQACDSGSQPSGAPYAATHRPSCPMGQAGD